MNFFSHIFFTSYCFENDKILKETCILPDKDENTDEKLIDTLMDLGGYAILSKVYVSQLSKGNYER